jgi:hypothetical protein
MKTRTQKSKRKVKPMKHDPYKRSGWTGIGNGGYMRARLIHSLVLAAALLCGLPALADLTVVVTPGYVFSVGENPTTETLNEMGLPTISIFGTSTGSNSISPASITGIQMVDAFPDGGVLNLPSGLQTLRRIRRHWGLSDQRHRPDY